MTEPRQPLDDRQLDALLERLDRLSEELHVMNSRLDSTGRSCGSPTSCGR